VRSAQMLPGRRLLAVLEPGEEVLASLAALCERSQFTAAVIPVFLGAFTSVTLIGTTEPVPDEDVPLPLSTVVEWVEGFGTATVFPGPDGGPAVHLHAAVGRRSTGALGYAGHVLSAVTHYTAEVIIEEVTGPLAQRLPDPAAHMLTTLHLPGAAGSCLAPAPGPGKGDKP
jgi:predicted DNA-binding protein with PD1-like motif